MNPLSYYFTTIFEAQKAVMEMEPEKCIRCGNTSDKCDCEDSVIDFG